VEPFALARQRAVHVAPAAAAEDAPAGPEPAAERATRPAAQKLRMRRGAEGKHGGSCGTREKIMWFHDRFSSRGRGPSATFEENYDGRGRILPAAADNLAI
jgi:hypothetical protein